MADQHDEAGQISQILTPLGYRTEMTHDQAGRLVERIDPDGACWSYDYDEAGHLETATAPDGGRTRYTWGPDGRSPRSLTQPAPRRHWRMTRWGIWRGSVYPTGASWGFLRDAMARLCGVKDRMGPTGAPPTTSSEN